MVDAEQGSNNLVYTLKGRSEAKNYQRNGVKSISLTPLQQQLDSIRGAPVDYYNCKTADGA